jgi:hypothetical protein
MNTPRTYLGRDQNMAGMIRVYLLPDAVEIDEISFVEIERTRVYFDDVLAITYHRKRSVGFLVLMGVVVGLMSLIGIGVLSESRVGGLLWYLFSVVPPLLTFLFHVILQTDYVTIFGRRTMARMRFRVRKGRAREVYETLAKRIRAVQAAAAAAAAAAQPSEPPATPELPPGPPVAAGPDAPPSA